MRVIDGVASLVRTGAGVSVWARQKAGRRDAIRGPRYNTIYDSISAETIYKGAGSTIIHGVSPEQIYDASKKPTDLTSLASSQAGSQIAAAFQQPKNAWPINFLSTPPRTRLT